MKPTYSVAEVAAAMCGDDMKDPTRWLLRRIYEGRVTARKIGRTWRMTDADVDAALEVFRSGRVESPVEELAPLQLTALSQRRRVS